MQLPYFQTEIEILNRLQTKWISILNPLFSIPISNGVLIKNVALETAASGTTVSHNLGRVPNGFIVVDMVGNPVTVSRIAWTEKTITLATTNVATIALWVF